VVYISTGLMLVGILRQWRWFCWNESAFSTTFQISTW